MDLNGKQRKRLRLLAQDIEPTVMIGKNGLTEAIVKTTEEELNYHELIKVRFSNHKDEKRELTDALAERTGAEIAGRIGHVVILFRQNRDAEKRKIRI